MSDKASGLPEKHDAAAQELPGTGERPGMKPVSVTVSEAEAVAPRPAWIEVDLAQLRTNFQLIMKDKPAQVSVLSVVKDEAYGHGAVPVAKVALETGSEFLGVSTLDEALDLREGSITAPILMLGERTMEELPYCLENDLTCCINRIETARELDRLARAKGSAVPVHLKIDTGMCRYGVRWTEAMPLIEELRALEWIRLDGVMSHFSMSDELDKTYANLQWSRFQEVLGQLEARRIEVPLRHLCNSGGLLDLPQAHLDMVRIGILPLGVYPSQVCRRIPGIQPAMSVKCQIASMQTLSAGESVGYGMRYTANSTRRIGVLPMGYGDGFPRVRNTGEVLVRGRRAPVVGANAMDATMIDLTDIPEAALWDEVVVMGRQGNDEISVHDIARSGSTVSYHILCGWRLRLPRYYSDSDSDSGSGKSKST